MMDISAIVILRILPRIPTRSRQELKYNTQPGYTNSLCRESIQKTYVMLLKMDLDAIVK